MLTVAQDRAELVARPTREDASRRVRVFAVPANPPARVRLAVLGATAFLLLCSTSTLTTVSPTSAATSHKASLGTHGAAIWTVGGSISVNLKAMTPGTWKQELWSNTCASPRARLAVLPSLVVPTTRTLQKTTKAPVIPSTRLGVILRLVHGSSTVCGVFITSPRVPRPLTEVTSWEYLIATNTGTPGIYRAIATSRADLLIMGGGSYDPPLDRAAADPTGRKLILGYQNVSEAAAYMFPAFFAGGALPAWFGHLIPGYSWLYSVQYWNPAWKSAIFANIDKIVANGYDGIYLDSCSGDSDWSPGNPEGNPVYPDATSAMATLLADIRTHLKRAYPGRKLYLIGNDPTGVAANFPADLKNLDAIMQEWVYYGASATDVMVSEYKGRSVANYIESTLAPLYQSAGVPVIGNDYPSPLNDRSAALSSFEFYTSLGWVPSVTKVTGGVRILSTGPFMFMATPSDTTVTGYPNYVNYLSGGRTAAATLVGGNRGDYFIGGPGENTIRGGAGNDTIYAQPRDAGYKDRIVVHLSSTIKNGTTPSVSILVNGEVAVAPTPITVAWDAGTQEFMIDAAPYLPISSLSLVVTGTSYTDMDNYSNIEINDISYDGKPLDLTAGVYTSGGSNGGYSFSNNGTVDFPGSSFTSGANWMKNTSDHIDGGGGVNTVIYRGSYGNYSVVRQADGSYVVTSGTTAEGPDTLRNVQKLVFADRQVDLP
jgi:endo-alpha-1,4-polygalactosaminidase (GH114 family)